MKESISLEEFIRVNKDLFSKAEIERHLGIPSRTLQRVIDGRKVPAKYRVTLIMFFKELGQNISLD